MGSELASAEALYTQILEEDPHCIEALHGLSLCLFQQRKLSEAKKILEKAVSLAPQENELLVSLAIVCQHLGLWDEAAAALVTVHSPRASLMLAGIYLRQLKHAEAKAILKDILSQDPKNTEALKMLTQAYVGLGKYHLAIQILEKFVSEPVVLEALKTEIFLMKKDFRNAEKHAARCVELDPKRANFYNILGYCQIKTLKLNEAVASFKKGLALEPDHPANIERGKYLANHVSVMVS